MSKTKTIIFDGECSLCNGIIDWLFQQLPRDEFNYVAFQSPEGQELLKHYGFNLYRLDTVILIDDEGLHLHSTGLLRVLRLTNRWHALSSLALKFPRPLRDGVYRIAARNRMRWFGASGQCHIQLPLANH
ncbi:thiol-disulfide oxidoreductase DCC family protein [Aureitalea marina]|uniref:Thiol-disulfide oxidoreductase n=1 Tax=Aureitalea marina TaxID=930804 RepID=A0A2S7KR21_9FLAO|nr:DCC1-like thiol-disulfide oxidoreductase family protein [Aureitalea marina]PQB05013.1 hypothetical protein BST85_09000 [Aureitalea marina]